MAKLERILGGLAFAEGPRWHDGKLWFSDMHDHWVMTVDESGVAEKIVEVPNQPSGLGWRPDGTLLIVSMVDRKLLSFSGGKLAEVADMSGLAPFHCNDMVVDGAGRAYVGNFGFDLFDPSVELTPEAIPTLPRTNMLRVDPDGSVIEVASGLAFPNGAVITPDGKTLVVGESMGLCLTAFDVAADGALSNRRVWAQFEAASPDGICLDEAGGIWVASPLSSEVLRAEESGKITHRYDTGRGAFACMLGGASGKKLFVCTADESHPDAVKANRTGAIEVIDAPYARAGLP